VSHTPWYTSSRIAQEAWKQGSPWLPEGARVPGLYTIEERGQLKLVGPFPICLPLEHARLNLLPSIADEALTRFALHGIEWHDHTVAPDGHAWPSTHLLDSQVQCVNVMLSLARDQPALLQVLSSIVPGASGLVPIEDDSVVAFEWIGGSDYLGEARGRQRHRGRFVTSVDALLVLNSSAGRTAILVEWKFTESYKRPIAYVGAGGTDRRAVYRGRFAAAPAMFPKGVPIEAFFHEPHYQLLRLHLLAAAMVDAGEFGIERAIVAWVAPRGNAALRTCVPDALKTFGDTVGEVWRALIHHPRVGFVDVSSDDLVAAPAELKHRYG
jgi:hypothetical protein